MDSRRFRRVLGALLLTVVALVGVVTVPAGPAAAYSDVDGDGLDDGLEDALASRFFPYVWFDSGENYGCSHPATSWNPGTALARVRRHPSDANKIAIQYVVLFREDCGDFAGLFSHNGDVEPFSITLAPNPACPHGYGAFSLKTIAHEGTGSEHIDQRLLGNSCNWGVQAGGSPYVSRIYASENKHGLYASDASCDAGVGGLDNCSETDLLPYNVFNVGEDHARRIDELSAYQFPGEYAWSSVPFRGSLGSGRGDAGLIRDKWTQDRLLAIGFDPPPSTRCNQPAHAWYQTPTNNQTIRQGQSLLVIAAGVQPDSVAQFQFFRNGSFVTYFQTRWANSNCVINQEYMYVNPGVFTPGTYEVWAAYEEPVSIGGSVPRFTRLPDLTVAAPSTGGGGGGGGGGGCLAGTRTAGATSQLLPPIC